MTLISINITEGTCQPLKLPREAEVMINLKWTSNIFWSAFDIPVIRPKYQLPKLLHSNYEYLKYPSCEKKILLKKINIYQTYGKFQDFSTSMLLFFIIFDNGNWSPWIRKMKVYFIMNAHTSWKMMHSKSPLSFWLSKNTLDKSQQRQINRKYWIFPRKSCLVTIDSWLEW